MVIARLGGKSEPTIRQGSYLRASFLDLLSCRFFEVFCLRQRVHGNHDGLHSFPLRKLASSIWAHSRLVRHDANRVKGPVNIPSTD